MADQFASGLLKKKNDRIKELEKRNERLEEENIRLRNKTIRYDNAFDYIDKSFQAEISSRKSMDMTDFAKGSVSSFISANEIVKREKESI
ncbi:hypothetical protein [Paraliobacillus ryukyuensis]|uniref:hypothetical protein n=1 Tax=Paraliobacillus ryukyuensis TaxID=200904 RepID=UPI0009A65DFB|nr:hypothetical protein [Paraliobacillus ryukyuensis]